MKELKAREKSKQPSVETGVEVKALGLGARLPRSMLCYLRNRRSEARYAAARSDPSPRREDVHQLLILTYRFRSSAGERDPAELYEAQMLY